MKQFCFLLLSLAVAVTGNLPEQKLVAPRFEDYPAIGWHGKVVSIDPPKPLAGAHVSNEHASTSRRRGGQLRWSLFTGLDGLRYRLFDYGHH
jgi:hypothetical protein